MAAFESRITHALTYGCSFGAKFMFLYSEKNFGIQRNIFLFRGCYSYSLYFQKCSYSKNFYYVVLCIFCYIQINLSYSEKKIVFKETFYIQRMSLCTEKNFIFRENVDIQRKPGI